MKFPEQFRCNRVAGYQSNKGDQFGMFVIPSRHANGRQLGVLACDGTQTGWEHVSVSTDNPRKCPSWEEMCIVKDLFWDPEETVIQFHPAKSEYVNVHTGCLHLWRYVNAEFPLPDRALVG